MSDDQSGKRRSGARPADRGPDLPSGSAPAANRPAQQPDRQPGHRPADEDQVTTVVRQWRRAAPGAVLLDGFHALKHALRFGAELRCAVTADRAGALALAAELAPDLTEAVRERVVEVPADVLRELAPRVHPTQVAALASRRSRHANLDELRRAPRPAPIVVLENPRNLGNVGAVVRLAAGFGTTGVVTTGALDPWHPHVVRAAAGLHYATAVERLSVDDLPPGPVYALDPAGEDIRNVPVPDDALLAFGSERHGISPELRARATRLLAVPMRPQVSSFNLATTVAMALYHWLPASRELSPEATGGVGP